MPIVFKYTLGAPGIEGDQGLGQEETDWPYRPLSLPFGASDWPPPTSSPPSWRPQAVPLFPQPDVTPRRETK